MNTENGAPSQHVWVKFETPALIDAAQSLIAVSSILVAVSEQYASTGALSVGAILHTANVVDSVIEKLKLTDLIVEEDSLPF